ncbi:lipase family protein [Cellulomonas soli]|uniref:lipase family protein n=1 Tax=Cellulomonas soli TaxID=931535 RepID=UPI003F828FE5
MVSRLPTAAVSGWLGRAPRVWRAVLGALCVVGGVWLLTRPLASLTTLVLVSAGCLLVAGVGELLPGPDRSRVAGAVQLAAAVVLVVWPGPSLRVVALLVGAAMVVSGARRAWGVRSARGLDRVVAAGLGGATLVLGLLALSWPDVTLLVVAVAFGARTLAVGLVHLLAAVRRTVPAVDPGGPAEGVTGPRRGRLAAAGAVLGLVLVLGLAAVSAAVHQGTPVVDAFYDAPQDVPDEAGALLRAAPFERDVPDGAQGWRILYTTTRDDGVPAVASALVVAPERHDAALPVIAWAHGTTGYARACAPSLAAHPFESGALFVTDQVVAEGWVLVATDYVGLGTEGPHGYLVGQGEGRAVLDAVRAAHALDGLRLDDRTVVWGHSQGGHAALWAGQLADQVAPDLDVRGVAALAPAADLGALLPALADVTGGSVFLSYAIAAYTATYDDVSFTATVRPAAQELVRAMSGRCLAEPGVAVSVLQALSLTRDPQVLAVDPTQGALGERLEQNTPTGHVPAPLLLAQGQADGLITPQIQAGYVARRCAAGQSLDYRVYPGLDHVGLVRADSPLVPELLAWTSARFDGDPAVSTCAGGGG